MRAAIQRRAPVYRIVGWVMGAGFLAGLLSPAVHVCVQYALRPFGYWLFPAFTHLPADMFAAWIVAPGAWLLGTILAALMLAPAFAGRRPVVRGALLGACLGIANVFLSVLLGAVLYRLRGGDNPIWTGWSGMRALARYVPYALPVALPCGALLGAVVALTISWFRPRSPSATD